MKLIKALKALAHQESKPDESILAEIKSDRRFHSRYRVVLANQLVAEYANSVQGDIIDIGYNGIGVAFENSDAFLRTSILSALQCQIKVFTESFPCNFVSMRLRRETPAKTIVGYTIDHGDINLLKFLRKTVEPLRLGTTAREVNNGTYREKQGSHYFRGEGPVDIALSVDDDDGGESVLVTFMEGGVYKEARLVKDRVDTYISHRETADPMRQGQTMVESHTPDASIVQTATLILLGAVKNNPRLTELTLKFCNLAKSDKA